jgi:hypothetical protein
MVRALAGDRRELASMLRYRENKITDDLREFLAWLIDKKEGHRPKLPAKFKLLKQWARDPAMFDAVMEFEMERTHWRHSNTGRKFPYRDYLTKIARRYGVDADTLHNKLRRGPKSGRKVGG